MLSNLSFNKSVKSFEESSLPSTLSTFRLFKSSIAWTLLDTSWATLFSNKVSAWVRLRVSVSILFWSLISSCSLLWASSLIFLDITAKSSLWFSIAVVRESLMACSAALALSTSVWIAVVLLVTFSLSSAKEPVTPLLRLSILVLKASSPALRSLISWSIRALIFSSSFARAVDSVFIKPVNLLSNKVSAEVLSEISLSIFCCKTVSPASLFETSVFKSIFTLSTWDLRLVSALALASASALTMPFNSA